MKTTRYYEENVLRRRPYLRCEWYERALRDPRRREVQPNGRVRYWIFLEEMRKYLRVVTLADGETVHSAFPDRRFTPEGDRG